MAAALDVKQEFRKAVQHFWRTRARQHKRQGAASGRKDAGNRAAVTGGKHADGFIKMIAAVVKSAGLKDAHVLCKEKRKRTLPGFFRPCKEWDLVVVCGTELVAVIEVKSQVGSFGNNFNNRVEEALGNATDFWAAYAKGLMKPSQRPWLGYMLMLEQVVGSTTPTKHISLAPFAVDPAFQRRSYIKRYELVCERLVRERLYDGACFFTSHAATGIKGDYEEPNPELGIVNFTRSLYACAAAFAKIK
jgi:hypothetical protein